MSSEKPALSKREREILDLAAAGFTDAGIAHRLGISVPTIGTYWNRIRAKVGPYSRTEIVAQLLAEENRRAIEELKRKYEELLADTERGPWRELVLNAPDAIILVDEAGLIQEANMEASKLFGYEEGELAGKPLHVLVPMEKRISHVQLMKEYIRNPERKKMGQHMGTAALRKDGATLMIAADLSGFKSGDKTMVACIIRPLV